jgi:hypothetical protein
MKKIENKEGILAVSILVVSFEHYAFILVKATIFISTQLKDQNIQTHSK